MPSAVAPTFRGVALVVLAAVQLALFGACTVEAGTTPSCVPNVDANGITIGVENGCTGFATCSANPAKPAECCKASDGTPYQGTQLELCLYAYGAGPAPTSSATTGASTSGSGGGGSSGTSTSSTSTTSTSGTGTSSTGTGAGGAGGGP